MDYFSFMTSIPFLFCAISSQADVYASTKLSYFFILLIFIVILFLYIFFPFQDKQHEGARCHIEHLCGEKFGMLSHNDEAVSKTFKPIKLTVKKLETRKVKRQHIFLSFSVQLKHS